MDDSGGLFLPLVRWPNAPAATTHRVTCISASHEQMHCVTTGASNGSLVLWRTPFVEPHVLVEGHTARVGALCDAVFQHTQDDAAVPQQPQQPQQQQQHTESEIDLRVVVSFADDGSVGVWRYLDGECVAFVSPRTASLMAECAVRHAVLLADRRTVVCAGESSPHLLLFDVWKMHVVSVLPREAAPLRSLCVLPASDTLLVAYGNGLVTASTSAVIAAGERGVACVAAAAAAAAAPVLSLCVFGVGAVALSATAQRASILASGGAESVVIASVEAPAGVAWIGAVCLSAQSFCCWDASGTLFAYTFNDKLLAAASRLSGASATFASGKTVDFDAAGCALELVCVRGSASSAADTPIECAATVTATAGVSQGQSVALGTADGRLCFFRFVNGALPADSPVVRAWTHAWTPLTRYALRNSAPIAAADVANTTCSFVTTSPTGATLLLISGHASGAISIAEFPDTAASQPGAFNRHWAAHTGAVLRLTAMNVHGTWYLISAGVDCTVCVWLLKGARHIHTFREHVSPVIGLRALPPVGEADSKRADGLLHVPLDTCFLTVASDRTVCIYSLAALKCVRRFGGHVTPLVAVWWRPAFDYVFVLCADDTFAVWELSTGRRESSQRGEDVPGITADAELLWQASERRTPVGGQIGNDGVAPFVFPVGVRFDRGDAPALASISTPSPLVTRCSDVQVIVLNVRELIEAVRAGQLAALAAQTAAAPSGVVASKEQYSGVQRRDSERMQLALELITLLLPWGADSNIDRLCREEIGFKRPLIPPTHATLGAASKMSFLLPTLTAAAAGGRIEDADVRSSADLLAHMWHSLAAYSQSSEMTALHSVTTASLLRLMLGSPRENTANAAAEVLTYLCTLMPAKMPTYFPPSFEFLTLHYFDNDDEIAQTSRTLFTSSLDAALANDVQFVQRWAFRYATEQSPFERCLSVLLLGIVGATNPDLLGVDLQRTIADELYTGVFRESGVLQAACGELLARGYNAWCGHLMRPSDASDGADAHSADDGSGSSGSSSNAPPKRNILQVAFKRSTGSLTTLADVAVAAESKMLGARLDGVVLQLFCLSMANDAAHLSSRRTARTARQALLQIGARDPRRFLSVLGEELKHAHKHTAERPMPYVDQRNSSHVPATRHAGLSLLESLPARASHSRRRLVAEFDAPAGVKHSPATTTTTTTSGSSAAATTASTSESSLMAFTGSSVAVLVRGADRRASGGGGGGALMQHNPGQSATHALKLIMALLMEEHGRILPMLERVVEIAVRALDPHVPQVRDGALQATTQLLQYLVQKFPNVSFHRDTQRLALGTPQATVVIYDLKAATKWHVFDGHTSSIAAVAYSDSGRLIASYSYKDRALIVWNVATSFLGFGTPSLKSSHKVTAAELAHDDFAALLATRLTWRGETALRLVRPGHPDFDVEGV
jgi:WD40 repeat protein